MSAVEAQKIRYLTVSETTQLLNRLLEESFPQLLLTGEISSVTRAGSGHLYFTLKDERSQIRAVMWSSAVRALTFTPETGMLVLCHGKPNVYSGSGALQVVVHKMMPSGTGVLQQKFLQLKEKLEREGFFAPHRKRMLPFLPKAVGVVTSSKGAVIHDIMVKIRERFPAMKVYLVDVRVQGEGAAHEIATGISYLDSLGIVDVIIVGRGGGSLEDLWAFNEEAVVKAIFRATVPVISGVGHEVDISLSDLVADVRAPTPTAAAELVVPQRDELQAVISQHERRLSQYGRWLLPLVQRVDEVEVRLSRALLSQLDEARAHLSTAEARLRLIEPGRFIATLRSKVDLLEQRLYRIAERTVERQRHELTRLEHRLQRVSPSQHLPMLQQRVDHLGTRLLRASQNGVHMAGERVLALKEKLDALSPRRVLERGYAIVESPQGIVTSSKILALEQQIRVRFYEGVIAAKVTAKE